MNKLGIKYLSQEPELLEGMQNNIQVVWLKHKLE